jgi:hypothetical protein
MKKLLALLLLLFSVGAYTLSPAEARYYGYDNNGGYFGYHPYIQKALIGGGIGAVAGGLLGRRDPVGAGLKGALLGSAAGVGYQYLRSRNNYGGYSGYGRGYGGGNYSRFNGGNYGNRGYYGRGCGHHHGRGHHQDWDD